LEVAVPSAWKIDPEHSSIHFVVRYMVIGRVHGAFDRWSGTFEMEDDLTSARVTASIEAASINTSIPARDNHLRSADFFDVERFPSLNYTSSAVVPLGDKRFRLLGTLALHGATCEVPLDVNYHGSAVDPYGMQRIGFTARGTIDRGKFGLNWNQLLNDGSVHAHERIEAVLVGQAVELEIDVQAMREHQGPARPVTLSAIPRVVPR
jgi:polyisoprenoid-binding protein YceI